MRTPRLFPPGLAIPALLLSAALTAAAQPKQPAKLSPVRITLHQGEDGPPLPAGYEFVSGEPVYVSFRVAGVKQVKDRVDVRWQIIATDPDGLLLFPALNGAIREEVSAADETWLPRVQQTLALPAMLTSGVYRMKIRVADELAQASAEQTLEFKVRGRTYEPPGQIAVRNLKLYREENDRFPAEPPLFTAGATIWIRFDLAAFSIGDKNRIDVEYDVAVLRPSGKVLFEQNNAAAESDTPFYPKRAMYGGFSINTTPDLSPGEYTVIIRARDKQAGNAVEEKATFRVEKAP